MGAGIFCGNKRELLTPAYPFLRWRNERLNWFSTWRKLPDPILAFDDSQLDDCTSYMLLDLNSLPVGSKINLYIHSKKISDKSIAYICRVDYLNVLDVRSSSISHDGAKKIKENKPLLVMLPNLLSRQGKMGPGSRFVRTLAAQIPHGPAAVAATYVSPRREPWE